MIARINFTKPVGADVSEIATFIYDALSSWGGQFCPDDPLFNSLTIKEIIINGKKFKIKEQES